MKQQRLDGLADGIFAIVMTLLVFELKVPIFAGVSDPSDSSLLNALAGSWTTFISLILSFALLFTYWRAHHFIASVYAKNLTVGLANINAIFFFLITLVPFAAHFLGEYPHSRVAIIFYGITVIAIGFSLFYMRILVECSPTIETSIITKADRRSGYIRILFPVFSAAVAILLSYWNTLFSMILFTIAILFNVLPASSNIIHRWLDLMFSDDSDLIESNHSHIAGPNGPDEKNLAENEEYICVPRSAVFDHHRFRAKDANVADGMLREAASAKTLKRAPAKKKQKKAAKAAAAEGRRAPMTKKSIEKAIERQIAKDITEGEVQEVVVEKDAMEA